MALPTRLFRTRDPQQQQMPMLGGADPFAFMRRDFADMMSRFFGAGGGAEMEEFGRMAPFGVDIREDADRIYVEADMPGFAKEDIDVSLDAGVLTIRAEKSEQRQTPGQQGQQPQQKQSKQQEQPNYLLRERGYRRFERSFTLPPNVDEQNVDAKLDNGCLLITLNKTQESKPRKITVQ